jgi:hypothetical protein
MKTNTKAQLDVRMASPRATLAFSVLDTVQGTIALFRRVRSALKSRFRASSAERVVRQGSFGIGRHDEHLPAFRSQRHRLPPRQRNSAALVP